MSETLWGVIAGGAIGIAGSLALAQLATRNERGRRRRDYEIALIARTVRMLDKWEQVALFTLSGNEERLRVVGAEMRKLDDEWDWDPDVIPGTAARELQNLAQGIYVGRTRADEGDPFGLQNKLMSLQNEMRASASRRTRELQ